MKTDMEKEKKVLCSWSIAEHSSSFEKVLMIVLDENNGEFNVCWSNSISVIMFDNFLDARERALSILKFYNKSQYTIKRLK